MNFPQFLKNKKFYVLSLVVLIGFFLFTGVSSVSAAGCGKNQEEFSFSSFLNPIASLAKKVIKGFGYEIALATIPDPDNCGSDNVHCTGSQPVVDLTWVVAPDIGIPFRCYVVNINGTNYAAFSSGLTLGVPANSTVGWQVKEAYYCTGSALPGCDGPLNWENGGRAGSLDYCWASGVDPATIPSGSFTTSALNCAACFGINTPDSVTTNQTFNASITMHNNGFKAWTNASPHQLALESDRTKWTPAEIPLPSSPVNPGQNATFNFNATAPATPGTYAFNWRMIEQGIEWFGATCQKNINVLLNAPKGWHDGSGCNVSTGWACDADDYNQALDIHFYDGLAGSGGVFIGNVTANQPREAGVGAECGGNPNHGFVFTTPESLKDGNSHTIYVYAINIGPAAVNPMLSGSPKSITCAPPLGDFNLSLGGSVACNSVPLSWTAASGADAYRILRGSPRVDISPYQPYTALNFTDTTVSQNTSYQYQIEAYNSGGTNRSNALNVTTPYCPPTVDLSANPTSIYQGQSSTLTWSSAYATSCTASGGWSGSKPVNGSQVVVPLPPPSVTYNLQCSGPGGSALASATIDIAPLFLPDWIEVIPR